MPCRVPCSPGSASFASGSIPAPGQKIRIDATSENTAPTKKARLLDLSRRHGRPQFSGWRGRPRLSGWRGRSQFSGRRDRRVSCRAGPTVRPARWCLNSPWIALHYPTCAAWTVLSCRRGKVVHMAVDGGVEHRADHPGGPLQNRVDLSHREIDLLGQLGWLVRIPVTRRDADRSSASTGGISQSETLIQL